MVDLHRLIAIPSVIFIFGGNRWKIYWFILCYGSWTCIIVHKIYIGYNEAKTKTLQSSYNLLNLYMVTRKFRNQILFGGYKGISNLNKIAAQNKINLLTTSASGYLCNGSMNQTTYCVVFTLPHSKKYEFRMEQSILGTYVTVQTHFQEIILVNWFSFYFLRNKLIHI